MRPYIIRRLLLMIPTLLLVSLVSFFLAHLIPGDIIDAMQGTSQELAINRPALEHTLGLDRSVLVQYGRWLGVVPQMDGSFSGVFQGNLGWSFWQSESVVNLMANALPVSIELGLMALVIGQLIALPIGIY